MLNFNSINSKLVNVILPKAFSDKYLGGYFEFSTDKEFIGIVKKKTGLNTTIFTTSLNNNFPQLQNVSLRTKIIDYTMSGGSTEVATEEGRKICNLKAKGEFLERLSTSFPLDLVKRTKGNDKALGLFSKKELWAKNLFSFGYTKIKSKYIYYLLPMSNKEITTFLRQPTTNGAAGHFCYDKAVAKAFLETIERDAFLVYWLNTISPKKIDVDSYLSKKSHMEVEGFKSLERIIADFKKYNIEYYFLDITSDIDVPVVCCVLVVDSKDGKRIAVGASAGFAIASTLVSSATEAATVASVNYFKEPYSLKDQYVPFEDKAIGRSERLRIYTTDSMFESASFFFKNKTLISVEDWSTVEGRIIARGYTTSSLHCSPKTTLKYLGAIFKQRAKFNKDYKVVVYEIKNQLLETFNYKVVRVFCDALYSLYLNENYANPNHPRLREFVKNKGLEKVAKLNTLPHLFP